MFIDSRIEHIEDLKKEHKGSFLSRSVLKENKENGESKEKELLEYFLEKLKELKDIILHMGDIKKIAEAMMDEDKNNKVATFESLANSMGRCPYIIEGSLAGDEAKELLGIYSFFNFENKKNEKSSKLLKIASCIEKLHLWYHF